MSTTTATILIGKAHPFHKGINPTYLIRFTENDRPALILHSLEGKVGSKVIIPTLNNTINDIYLMVSVFILNKVKPSKVINNFKRKSLYEILDEKERSTLYKGSKKTIQSSKIKIVFNIFEDCHLLSQIDFIKTLQSILRLRFHL